MTKFYYIGGRQVKERLDYTGKKFGRLTVIEYSHNDKKRQTYWKFRCDCGVEKVIRIGHVITGKIKSCGCYNKEKRKERANNGLLSSANLKHGDRVKSNKGFRLYNIFCAMKYRCENSKHMAFRWYGARGITLCVEWNNYEIFKKWALKNGYQENLTIDRIDNDGNYEPSNCQWLTRSDNTKKQWKDKKKMN
jgi:hypothetical protein